MATITLWDKVRSTLGLGYTTATLQAIGAERQALRAAGIKAELAKAKAVAAAKAETEAAAKAAAKKTPSQPKATVTPIKKTSAGTGKTASSGTKKPTEATRDGDGDGYINDGKPNERKVSAKKPAAKKTTTAKATPKPKK